MYKLLFVLLFATNVHAACEKQLISSSGAEQLWTTVCDSNWEKLGASVGWARLCGYGGDIGKRLLTTHNQVKSHLDSSSADKGSKKAYQTAMLSKLHYDSASNCSKARVEEIINFAELMVSADTSVPEKQSEVANAIPRVRSDTSASGDLLALENSTALVVIDQQIQQLIVKSDGEEYQRVWDAVAAKQSIDVGLFVSEKRIDPKRFEFSWNPLRDGYATKIDGVSTILIGDEQIFEEVMTAYRNSARYVYLGAKFNDTMRFRWWRLTRASQ